MVRDVRVLFNFSMVVVLVENQFCVTLFGTDVVVRFFLCFSLIQNTSRIMDTNVPPSAITAINGMRVMSMWWVILGHVYGFQMVAPISKYSLAKML